MNIEWGFIEKWIFNILLSFSTLLRATICTKLEYNFQTFSTLISRESPLSKKKRKKKNVFSCSRNINNNILKVIKLLLIIFKLYSVHIQGIQLFLVDNSKKMKTILIRFFFTIFLVPSIPNYEAISVIFHIVTSRIFS